MNFKQTYSTDAFMVTSIIEDMSLEGAWQKIGKTSIDTISVVGGCDSIVSTNLAIATCFLCNKKTK